MIWLAIWSILDFASVTHHEPPNAEIPAVVCEYFADDCPRALGIAWCESLHNPRAYNGVDHGLFQINENYWGHVFERHWHKRYEVEQSTKFAAYIIENTKAKWDLWTCGRIK